MRAPVSCGLGKGWLGLPSLPDAAAAGAAQQQQQQRTKLVNQRRKRGWQWSKGDGPGEYGGPPATISDKPFKMWGKPVEDPLSSTDDFIWNKDWRPFFNQDEESAAPAAQSQVVEAEQSSGFLSFQRVAEIDSVDTDLSKELLKSVAMNTAQTVAEDTTPKKRWLYAPTRKERKNWDRARKATESQSTARHQAGKGSRAPAEVRNYKQLASRLQILTIAIGSAGTVTALVVYSSEVALSYGVGLMGAFAYVRMLGSSVGSLGRSDAKGAIKGALGQPRLLVPVILTMTFNRWNELLVPDFGFAHLQLIPMLVGFFTYKLATVAQVIQDVFPELGYNNESDGA